MTGLEVRAALDAILDICLAHRIRLRLGPGITVDIVGVHHGGGGAEGFWCEFEGGSMHFSIGDTT